MIQFTADCHINDYNILHFQPERYKIFGATNEIITMNIINKQNNTVDINDTVQVLGDFIIGNDIETIKQILIKLNGNINLIVGNHDNVDLLLQIDYSKLKIFFTIQQISIVNNIELVLYHYPLFEQPNYYNNVFHLYGHVHGKYGTYNNRALDIGFNVHNFELLSEYQISSYLKKIIN